MDPMEQKCVIVEVSLKFAFLKFQATLSAKGSIQLFLRALGMDCFHTKV